MCPLFLYRTFRKKSLDNTQFRTFDEVDDVLDFLAHRDLIFDHQEGIEQAGVALIDNPVGVADVLDNLFFHAFVGKDK